MSKHLTILPAVAALLLTTACSSDDNLTDDTNAPVELRLTSSVEVQTRGTHGLDTQIAKDEKVYVWVDDAVTSDNLYENNALTADGSGGLSGTTMYFPSSGNAVNIYAIHGDLSYTDFWNESVTHTVAQDQTSESGSYATSDLVYCEKTNVARTSNTINLTFQHLLSKVEVVLYEGDGAPSIKTVEILNTQLEAEFTPAKGSDIAVTASGSTGAIAIDADVTEADGDAILNEAIIVPQTLAGGTQFIRITTDKGGVLYYITPTDGVTFAAGKKYRYNITVSLTGLEVTTEIDDWTDGGTVDSTAKM